ncbi:MAG: helicase-related protein, partial [Candidatus Hodarchaeales archaeon]
LQNESNEGQVLWYYEDLRLVTRNTDAFLVYPVEDKSTTHRIVTEVILKSSNYTEKDLSSLQYEEMLGTIPTEKLEKLKAKFKPLKTLEELCLSKGRNIIFNAKTGHGKTHQVCLYFLDQIYADKKRYILSFVHSRGVGRTHQQKFDDLCKLMSIEEEKAEGYFRGQDQIKERIRAGEINPSMLLITPQTFIGSLNNYYPIKTLKNDLEYYSTNVDWGKRLASPTFIFIDEVDSFPLSTLMLLVPIVRTLQWKNPDLQIILASGTLKESKRLAQQFFGLNENFIAINGSGRRGDLKIKAFYEDQPEIVLKERLRAVTRHIRSELKKVEDGHNYQPEKVIIFINHKLTIDIHKITGQFNKNFITVHGNMDFKNIQERLEEFRTNPIKLCLVTTQLIQSGVDLPDVTWGIFYGLLENTQQFQQIRDRINRDPDKEGKLDIILRSTNDFERQMAEPENKKQLDNFLLNQKPVSLLLPAYTPFSLRVWLILGVILGIRELVWRIGQEVSIIDKTNNYQKELERAIKDLERNGYIQHDSEGELVPTYKTKRWVVENIIRSQNNRNCTIIQNETERKVVLGQIDYLTVLRHHLVNQSLPLGDYNYRVKSISFDQSNLWTRIFVKPLTPDLVFYKNKVVKHVQREKLLAYEPDTGLVLMVLQQVHSVVGLDERTEISGEHLFIPPLVLKHPAIFIRLNNRLLEDTNKEKSLSKLKHQFKVELNINPQELDYCDYEDAKLGKGVLIVDKSNIQLAELIYYYLYRKTYVPQKKNKAVMAKKDIQGLHFAKFKRPFYHLRKFLGRYQNVIAIFGDVHLDGSPFKVDGEEIDLRAFWRYVLGALKEVSHIFFLGDTLDWTEINNSKQAHEQLNVLNGILEEYNLLARTVFFRGNHDYDQMLFVWRVPICVKKELLLPLPDGSYAHFS